MLTSLKRILKFSWLGFLRNKALVLEVIFVMTISVSLITCLFMFQGISEFLISYLQDKADISVYFNQNTSEQEIVKVEEALYQFSNEIESVEYISQEKALQIFTETHKNDPDSLEALEQVGDNPFLPSLVIKAHNPIYYIQISNFLSQDSFKDVINKIPYYDNKKVIDRLSAITDTIKTITIGLALFLGLLAILITFNTIKLGIFAAKDEISTMRLVGATNWFIKGPFVIQGILYGLISILVVDILFFVFLIFFSPKLQVFFSGFNLFNYFQTEYTSLFLIQIIFIGIVSIISTLLALNKHLKV
jgi:cell division transport system permease protein